jgi:hypothetical protein
LAATVCTCFEVNLSKEASTLDKSTSFTSFTKMLGP